jgi:hypothetical protein
VVAFYLLAAPPLGFKVRGRELFVGVVGKISGRQLTRTSRPHPTEIQIQAGAYVQGRRGFSPAGGELDIGMGVRLLRLASSGAVCLTKHRRGIRWAVEGLKDKDRVFPTTLLRDAKETLSEFIESNREF